MRNPFQNGNKAQLIPILLLLCLILSVSSCIVGYILGQRALPTSHGQIIDTILLDPNLGKQQETNPALSGRLCASDGTPYVNTRISLHSTPQETVTDDKGFFFFPNVEMGEHTVFVLDHAGTPILSVPITVTLLDTVESKVNLAWSAGCYTLSFSPDIMLLEIELTLDTAGKTLSLNADTMSILSRKGTLTTPHGTASLQGSTLVTPFGTAFLTDKTIVAAGGAGVKLPNHIFISRSGVVQYPDGTKIENGLVTYPDGKTASLKEATLPIGTMVQRDGSITLPGGAVVKVGEVLILPDGTKVTSSGEITLPDQTVIHPDNTITRPDGTKVDHEAGTITAPDGTVTQTVNKESGFLIGVNVTIPIGGITTQPTNPSLPLTPTNPTNPTTPSAEPTPPSTEPTTSPEPTEPTEPSEPTNPTDPNEPTEPPGPMEPTNPPGKPNGGGTGGTIPAPNWISPEVTQNGVSWTQLSTIDLFASSNSQANEKLYPGVEGYYLFAISNQNAMDLTFRMSISEAAHEVGQIPLQYRLKLESTGEYISNGNTWMCAEQLQAMKASLSRYCNVSYVLEWRWPYASGNDALDTALGSAENRTHYIHITIQAEM